MSNETEQSADTLDVAPEVTFEDLVAIGRRNQERFEQEQAALVPIGRGMTGFDGSFGSRSVAAATHGAPELTYTPRCEGGCLSFVRRRGDWCEPCRREGLKRAVGLALAEAYEAVSPGGSRAWCRADHPDFEAAMMGNMAAKPKPLPGLRWLYERLPASSRDSVIDDIVLRMQWGRSIGSVLVLGPLGIGKTPFITALAHRVLDAARDGRVPHDSLAFRAIAGIRYVSGIALGKAERRHALGRDEPPMITMAKRCPVLIMDEIGFGDDAEVSAVKEIIRERYERADCKPVLFGSGMTVDQLNQRFGDATMKCLWARGRVIDVHQIAAEVAKRRTAA